MAVTKLETKYDPERFLSHFFLVEEPFALTPDPRFLYLSPGHASALAKIDNGVTDRVGLIVLRGEMGTGKTTLAHSILSEWRNQIHVAYIGTGTFTPDDILRRAMIDFGLDQSGGPAEWDSRFERLLSRARDEDRLVVLMIDEAQSLSTETFDAITRLLNLESDEPALVQVVLIGQPELKQRMLEWQRRYENLPSGTRTRLGLLSKKESYNYIAHRLQSAGGVPEIFHPNAMKLIVREARGVPRRLNVVCHNALTIAFLKGAEQIDTGIARRAIKQSGTIGSRARRSQGLRLALVAIPLVLAGLYLAGQWLPAGRTHEAARSAAVDDLAVADQTPPASATEEPSQLDVPETEEAANEPDPVVTEDVPPAPEPPETPEPTAPSEPPSTAIEPPEVTAPKPTTSPVGLTSAAIALDVTDREPQGPSSSFPVDVERLYFWTSLTTDEATQVEHVWHFEDQEQARVPLRLGGNWRVWSWKTILPGQVGTWRVDVVDARGTLVDSLTFETYGLAEKP